ncbi:unnamed protein product [Orchesella dallaii]|uniref:DOMON domain-containing protein n=1 Tax=Orchesella dallaii TaxID=48710 RepID=A0ABP1RCD1_9HEXA
MAYKKKFLIASVILISDLVNSSNIPLHSGEESDLNYKGDTARLISTRGYIDDRALAKRSGSEGYRYYGSGSKSSNSFTPTNIHKSTSSSDSNNYFVTTKNGNSLKDMDTAGTHGNGMTSSHDGSYLTIYDSVPNSVAMMDDPYGEMVSETGHGHGGGGHGGGHGGGGGGKGCNSALGLLGVLGLAAYLQNVLRQMQNGTTGRRKRDIGFDDPFDSELGLDNIRNQMGLLEEYLLPLNETGNEEMKVDKETYSKVMRDIFPLLSAVAHAKDGLIPVHCTHSSVCLANQVLVRDLGYPTGHNIGIRISSAIAKLLTRITKDERAEQIRMISKAVYSSCIGQILNQDDDDSNPYKHIEMLDQEGRYMLEWIVHWEQRRVTFNVTVQTQGHITFGLTSRGDTTPADIVIGGVTSRGDSYFTDRYKVGNGRPVIDSRQDWTLHSSWENRTHTFLSFSRAFDTCDDQDYVINEYDRMMLIWGYGETDDVSEYRNSNQGQYHIYLLDPSVTPISLKRSTFRPGPPTTSELEALNLKVWTITKRTRLPAEDTHYHCTMHQAPRLGREHHIVGMNTRLESAQAAKHTHHLLLYRCTPPPDTDPVQFFSPHLNSSGQQCYFLSRPVGEIPTQYCTEIKYPWGIGQRIAFLPEYAGLSFGESLDEYYNLQVHYDNPDRESDIEYDIHIDIFYTDQLRPNQMGIMTAGHHIPGSPSLLIPPDSEDHRIYGHCGPDCTQTMFPPDGINLASFVKHTHYSGRKFKISHYRGNQELPWIANDNNYNSTFQEVRLLRSPLKIQPGDRLMTSCVMDNTWTNGTVVGGFSTKQEMCLAYFFYYNKLQDYSLCRSEIISQQYMQQYLGVNNITWDNDQLDYAATSPAYLAGQTVATISDNVNWTPELRRELQQDHQFLPQVNACSRSPFSSTGEGQVAGSQVVGAEVTIEVSYPTGVVEYVPPPQSDCRNPVFGRSRGHGAGKGWSRGRW